MRMNMAIDAQVAYGAVRPWDSIDSISESALREKDAAHLDKEKFRTQLELCMNCPYPECCNCLSGGKSCKRGRPKKVRVTFNA